MDQCFFNIVNPSPARRQKKLSPTLAGLLGQEQTRGGKAVAGYLLPAQPMRWRFSEAFGGRPRELADVASLPWRRSCPKLAQLFRLHDRPHLSQVGLAGLAHDQVLKMLPLGDFAASYAETLLDHLGRIFSA